MKRDEDYIALEVQSTDFFFRLDCRLDKEEFEDEIVESVEKRLSFDCSILLVVVVVETIECSSTKVDNRSDIRFQSIRLRSFLLSLAIPIQEDLKHQDERWRSCKCLFTMNDQSSFDVQSLIEKIQRLRKRFTSN